jgi:hypothetical protein
MDIEKQQFHNNTGGFLGVTIIGPRGDDRGISVGPDENVWLSEAEQRLTANAPRKAKDNPFIEQARQRMNPETGELEDYTLTPLTPVEGERFVPADLRPIPSTMSAHASLMEAQAAAKADEPSTPTVATVPALERHQEVEQTSDADLKPNVPPPPARAAAAASAAADDGKAKEEVGTPTPPSEPTPGSYTAQEETGTPPAPQTQPQQQPAPYAPQE